MNELKIIEVGHDDSSLHRLIEKLDADLLQRYPADEVFGLDFNDLALRSLCSWLHISGSRRLAVEPLDH